MSTPTNEMTADEFAKWPWVPMVVGDANDGYRLTVNGLPAFEVFAPNPEQLAAEWRLALKSHLTAYMRMGKEIPHPSVLSSNIPDLDTVASGAAEGEYVYLTDQLRMRDHALEASLLAAA